jgi:hypothetical protein
VHRSAELGQRGEVVPRSSARDADAQPQEKCRAIGEYRPAVRRSGVAAASSQEPTG